MIDVLVFPCTYKCDGKCIMCSIHEKKCSELGLSELCSFFSNEHIKTIRSINITGGEPTLREDIVEVVSMICSQCRNLREIIINTNGLNSDNVVQKCEKICSVVPSNVKVWIYVSLDALDATADKIRGVKNAAMRAMKTVDLLILLKARFENVEIGVSTTIVSANAMCLDSILQYVKNKRIYIDLILATVNTAYIDSKKKSGEFMLNDKEKAAVVDFMPQLLNYNKRTLTAEQIYMMIERVKGEKGNKQCILRDGKGILLEADGKIRACGMTNKILLGDIHDKDLNITRWAEQLEKYDEYCAECNTDSYYNWTSEAQNSIMREMLVKIANNKRNAKQGNYTINCNHCKK